MAVTGVYKAKPDGSGLLVESSSNYLPRKGSVAVPRDLVRKYGIEDGTAVTGEAIEAENRAPLLVAVETLEGMSSEDYGARLRFQELVASDPTEKFNLQTTPERISARVLDLLTPLGKGQRCLIVSPPKAGKTTLLKDIAHAVATNHPDVHLMVLLVDERPEEVTDIRRSVQGEVIASSNDESLDNHIGVSETVLERARRMVETGRDVVLLVDSITRMARAYNAGQRTSGKTLSGGIDSRTMEKPRRFFGSARKTESADGKNGGSLTIVATALVDTGSRMDEVIFQEFKGTGNTEIVLDHQLFERRIFPCINIPQSGTRKEEKLYSPSDLPKIYALRRALATKPAHEAMQMLLERLKKHPTNQDFLNSFKI